MTRLINYLSRFMIIVIKRFILLKLIRLKMLIKKPKKLQLLKL